MFIRPAQSVCSDAAKRGSHQSRHRPPQPMRGLQRGAVPRRSHAQLAIQPTARSGSTPTTAADNLTVLHVPETSRPRYETAAPTDPPQSAAQHCLPPRRCVWRRRRQILAGARVAHSRVPETPAKLSAVHVAPASAKHRAGDTRTPSGPQPAALRRTSKNRIPPPPDSPRTHRQPQPGHDHPAHEATAPTSQHPPDPRRHSYPPKHQAEQDDSKLLRTATAGRKTAEAGTQVHRHHTARDHPRNH